MLGFQRFFKHQTEKIKKQIDNLTQYQNERGGKFIMRETKAPNNVLWGSGIDCLQFTIRLEVELNQLLINYHTLAESHSDYQLSKFINSHFIAEKVCFTLKT